MRVAVLYNAVAADAEAAERDVLDQVDAVSSSLQILGHEPIGVTCTLDLKGLNDKLNRLRPDVVFNIVEGLEGSDRLLTVVPTLLDALGIPYTGVPAEGLFLSTNKLLAKEWLHRAGLPTPAWEVGGSSTAETLTAPCIIKSVFDHASFGIDDNAVIIDETADIGQVLREREAQWGRPCFAERYVEGREFNLSLLAGPNGPDVLPPAEIAFTDFPAGKPRILGYRAKWDVESFEYEHTVRRFEFLPAEWDLLTRMTRLSLQCWDLFHLRGCARVDFRVDSRGQPWILEINANPCLSPDAGFAAALMRAGIGFEQAVQRLLDDAQVQTRALTPALCD